MRAASIRAAEFGSASTTSSARLSDCGTCRLHRRVVLEIENGAQEVVELVMRAST
jgi:hypothetical protein